eukprot:TRINITY_DN1948_c0_g1_i1.p1 TRINITY_DN1948_c0_g1~~TRINITY_DN1948_c0_g1_i1.p1  ORF type:complete len:138 (+),score=28.72 TRINITY_DN1948_c0_g1_i1:75-488(+)
MHRSKILTRWAPLVQSSRIQWYLPSVYSHTSLTTSQYISYPNLSIWRSYSGGASGVTAEQARERIIRVVKDFHKVDPNKVSVNSHFTNDLGLDSLDQVELVLAFEDEFAIVLAEDDAEKIQNIDDAVEFISTNPNSK